MAVDERTKSLDGTRVLIVEDDYYLADDLSRSLVQAGAEVVGPVGTLAEAQSRVGGDDFDMAVIDMNLRGDFAYAVAERLDAERVPFVIATGYNEASLPEHLKNVPRVEKPFAARDVVSLLIDLREKIRPLD